MNYSALTNGFPKLRIKSEDVFFCLQINRILIEQDLLVDVIEDDEAKADICVYNYIPSKEEMEDALYSFLILNPADICKASLWSDNKNVRIYRLGELRESVLAEDIKNASITIIAEGRSGFGLTSLAKDLKNEQEKTEDYRIALRKSGEAQKLIMKPRFKDDNLDIKIVYEPYRDVSGDVLFVRKVYSKIFIMVADVTDHGCLAGMYGASLYALANNYIENTSLMEQSIGMWGNYMARASRMYQPYGLNAGDPMMSRFTANLLLSVIDLKDQKISFCFYGSGQEPPILINESGDAKKLKIDEGVGTPVGDEDTANTLVKVYKKGFYPGSGVVLYTDGLTEIFADATETEKKDTSKIYSADKVASSVNQALSQNKTSSEEIVNYILKDASAYSIASNLESDANRPNVTDDLTIMCLRWKGEYFD